MSKFKPVKLTWPEISRLIDIFSNSPCQEREQDKELAEKTKLIEIDDQTTYTKQGAEEHFFEYTPHARVKDCWRSIKILPSEKEAIIIQNGSTNVESE